MASSLEWKTYERINREHAPDWYWAVSIIALSIVITSIILDNVLFAVFIFVSTIVLFLRTLQKPRAEQYELTARGIKIGKEFVPYNSLESFWVEEECGEPKIIIKQQALIALFLIIPLGDMDPSAVREHLNLHLAEVEHHEPLSKKIMEFLGF